MSWKFLAPLVPLIAPLAGRWVAAHEAAILAAGESLTANELADARRAGVLQPERIRLQFVASIPMPEAGVLRQLGRRTGFVSSNTAGITLRYGIYIQRPYRGNRELYVHEFVHVGQYERLGSIEKFLRDYLRECLDPGYPWGPLEQEAVRRAQEIVRGEDGSVSR
jgi:hypothetical protein